MPHPSTRVSPFLPHIVGNSKEEKFSAKKKVLVASYLREHEGCLQLCPGKDSCDVSENMVALK